MKHRLYSFLIIVFLLAACSSKKATTPFQVNQHFASISDSLWQYGVNYSDSLRKAFQTKDFGSLAALRAEMETFVDRKIVDIKAMKDVKGSEEFRLAMLKFLDLQSSRSKEAFGPFERLSASSTDEDIKAAINNAKEFGKLENEYLRDVRRAQADYALKNGFAIAPLGEPIQ